MSPPVSDNVAAWRMVVGGQVQGVGFRPFVYRTAQRYELAGWVRNLVGRVEIRVEGRKAALEGFAHALIAEAPKLAQPALLSVRDAPPSHQRGFTIQASDAAGQSDSHIPTDQPPCAECLAEMADPADRRHAYPFTNCTQCGPRYTLIGRLPYDRANTAMAGFPLCPDCAADYANPGDRRFHAEPTACPACGPRLSFHAAEQLPMTGSAALAATLAALRQGALVAVKGVGGYHLMCDAHNESAIARLRARKNRPDKPLAVMVTASILQGVAALSPLHLAALHSPARPIVLAPHRACPTLPASIAPGLDEIGLMLPDSPLHHLLADGFGSPLVATSGNRGGDPMLTDPAEAERQLAGVADVFLHHDRPILRPADDPVRRVIAGAARPIRLGRGDAPLELELPFTLAEPVLALGGQMKATVALGWGRRVVVSPHLGDIAAPRSLARLAQTMDELQALYGVTARSLLCDAHPASLRATQLRAAGLPVRGVFHHEAHASALVGESDDQGDWIIFTWDGTGYGRDGTIWGGEALVGQPGQWRRGGTLRPFSSPGGDKVAHAPWRSALALCWEAGIPWPDCPEPTELLCHAWQRGLNSPRTSSAGRLFDAAAALIGTTHTTSFEGQAAMRLEAIADPAVEPIMLPMEARDDGVFVIDWAPLLGPLQDARLPAAQRAGLFHATLAAALVRQAEALRRTTWINRIGLTGGVFQNRKLTEQVVRRAGQAGFDVRLPARLPCNDAGLSFGQIIETGCPA